MAHVDQIAAYRILAHAVPRHLASDLARSGVVYGLPCHRATRREPGRVYLQVPGSCHTHVFRAEDVVPVTLRRTYTPAAAGLTDVAVEELPA